MLQKLEPKADCFAFQQKEKCVLCNALNDLYCKKEKCRFYMSKADYIEKNGQSYEQTMLELEKYNKYAKRLENLD